MTINFGDVPIGAVLPVHFGSYNAAGASVALTGLAVTDIEIYKGTTVTQRASDAGYALIDTDGIDIDGIVGANGFSIDTGDNTDAGFYAAGSYYNVWVAAVTIDGQTVNFLAATFRLVAAENTAGYPVIDAAKWNNLTTVALPLAPTTAGRTLDVSAGGEAGIDWANVGSPTTVVALSGTTVKTATDVETDTADIQSRLPAALTAGGNMKSDALAVNGDTTAAANLAKTTRAIGRGTVGAASTVTSVTTSAFAPSGVDADQFKGRIITFDADTVTTSLRGQATDITANTAAANPTFTVTALTSSPISGDTFSVT